MFWRGFVDIETDQNRLTREARRQVDGLLPLFYLPEHAVVRGT